MAQLIDNYILQVLLLTLCFLEINSTNTIQQFNLSTSNTNLTTVKQLEKAAVNETKVKVETLIDNTHNGREHMTSAPKVKQSTSNILITKSDLKKNESSVNGNTKMAFNTSKVNISTTIRPLKPIRTEHDELVEPLKSQVKDPTITHVDTSMDKKVRRADYIVPIVAVILSVPLVAVLISLLYKRGKDWWQHRNYRRMDYLIEGMYNS